jgi:hypothetical protein
MRCRKLVEKLLAKDPTLEKHVALADALKAQDAARQSNLAKA